MAEQATRRQEQLEGKIVKDQASGLVSVAQLTVTATTATASTIMSLGTVTDTAAEPSLSSAMTGVFAE